MFSMTCFELFFVVFLKKGHVVFCMVVNWFNLYGFELE